MASLLIVPFFFAYGFVDFFVVVTVDDDVDFFCSC